MSACKKSYWTLHWHTKPTDIVWQHCFAEANFKKQFSTTDLFVPNFWYCAYLLHKKRNPKMETTDVVYGQGFKTSLKGEGLSAGQTVWNSKIEFDVFSHQGCTKKIMQLCEKVSKEIYIFHNHWN